MKFCICVITLLCVSLFLRAQEENLRITQQGERYINIKTHSLEKYNLRIERQQRKLLKRLKKKEYKYARKLRNTDSAAFSRYKQHTITFDSISILSKSDTGSNLATAAKKKNSTVDSLKRIQTFISSKTEMAWDVPSTADEQLYELKGKLNYKAHITELITTRTNELKNIALQSNSVPALKGIEKNVFYCKARMKAFKEMEQEPILAEEKALEFLQGTDGFEQQMQADRVGGMGGAGAATGLVQLEAMGYQTKQQTQKMLQGKFGPNLGSVAGKVSSSMQLWQTQQQKLTEVKQGKQTLAGIRNTQKPSFKVNPMRGLPLCKRIEQQFSCQTTRADGTTPALLNLSVVAGFKHTAKLTYGLGLASNIGLGQGWQCIHFSFESIGYRTFASWEWQYGIGAYAGYERMYKATAFSPNSRSAIEDVFPTNHSNKLYNETVFIGVTKKYNISKSSNGYVQLLYDIWWQQKALRSPIVVRFIAAKK